MADSPFSPMDPILQGMSPDEIMMLLQRRQMAADPMQLRDYGLGPMTPTTQAGLPNDTAAPFTPSKHQDAGLAVRQGLTSMGMPGLGERLGPQAEMASGILHAPADAHAEQIGKAGSAARDFAGDPSIANASNVGVQTGAAMMQPGMMLGSAAIGVGDALLKDYGGVGEAQAQGKKKQAAKAPFAADIPDLQGLPEGMQAAYKDVKRQLESKEWMPRDTRRSLADQMNQFLKIAAEAAGREGDVEKQKKLDQQAEWDRKVRRADEVYATEMARDRRWSDTATGKILDKFGGFDPFLAAMGAGRVMGKVKSMMGPATSFSGKVAQSPFVAGTAAAFGMNNVADGYNASKLESDNPRKRALEGRGMELPVGHPDKQPAIDAARGMQDTNPIRDAAVKSLSDPYVMGGRLGFSLMEGVGAHVPGAYAYAKAKFKGAGAGAGQGATPLPAGPSGPQVPSGGPQAALPPPLPKQQFDPAKLAPPTPAQQASGFSKTASITDVQAAAKAHREAMAKYRNDPEAARFFDETRDLGPRQQAAAFSDRFGPLRPKSVAKLKELIGRDAQTKGVEAARAQLAETARTAQGEARMIWDSIARGGNASYRDIKTIAPQVREAHPELAHLTDRQLGNLIKGVARGQ